MNTYLPNYQKYKIFIATGVVFVLVLAGWTIWNLTRPAVVHSFDDCKKAGYQVVKGYPSQCSTPDGSRFLEVTYSQPVTLSGVLVCLPHKNTNGAQTAECAFGLKDSKGVFYGLSNPDVKVISQVPVGSKITVKGNLSTKVDSVYDIVGTVDVKTLTKN